MIKKSELRNRTDYHGSSSADDNNSLSPDQNGLPVHFLVNQNQSQSCGTKNDAPSSVAFDSDNLVSINETPEPGESVDGLVDAVDDIVSAAASLLQRSPCLPEDSSVMPSPPAPLSLQSLVSLNSHSRSSPLMLESSCTSLLESGAVVRPITLPQSDLSPVSALEPVDDEIGLGLSETETVSAGLAEVEVCCVSESARRLFDAGLEMLCSQLPPRSAKPSLVWPSIAPILDVGEGQKVASLSATPSLPCSLPSPSSPLPISLSCLSPSTSPSLSLSLSQSHSHSTYSTSPTFLTGLSGSILPSVGLNNINPFSHSFLTHYSPRSRSRSQSRSRSRSGSRSRSRSRSQSRSRSRSLSRSRSPPDAFASRLTDPAFADSTELTGFRGLIHETPAVTGIMMAADLDVFLAH
ncbi:unnamed protein product [Protopolystoma xenopodis]|uniref:Uncharacterized protein n=1 Tax=Protopolystoma xenopodis TaxID=117903 RepID=A0A3S5FCY9_9PLAT|nr:unnamed protein product [Protopolystoma xenopodis]